MEKKQTAVEWLLEQIKDYDYSNNNDYYFLKIPFYMFQEKKETALQMEKEQMEKCYEHGNLALLPTGHADTFEEYYNETYGSTQR